tara:strand:+ start:39270 stop:40334 length:1065 start_codon:yes stop_codon:yes gene_type:complete
MRKRGQVTIYLIVGVLLLGLTLLILFQLGIFPPKQSYSEKASLTNFVEDCIRQQTETAVFHAAFHSGRIFLPLDMIFSTESLDLAYAYKNKQNYLDKGQTEKDIATYLDLTLQSCTNNFLPWQNQGVTIKEIGNYPIEGKLINTDLFGTKHGASFSNIVLTKDNIKADVQYPLSIKELDEITFIEDFSVEVPTKLFSAMDDANKIIQSTLQTNKMELSMLSNLEPFVKIMPYDSENTIYSLFYGENAVPDYFIFVLNSKFNQAPRLNHIPNFQLTVDVPFSYQIQGIDVDQDKLIYTSNSEDFPIHENGTVSFTPKRRGDFTIQVKVTDNSGLQAQQQFNVSTKEEIIGILEDE